MRFIKYIFTPNHVKYDGVRPINIYLLRMFYFLMAGFVATDAWTGIVNHQGPWDPYRAMATCVWAAYATLGILGLIHPLKMLPIMVFMVFYKTLWLIVVAFPLWRSGTLAGSAAAEMTSAFIGVPAAMIAVPWIYFFKNFVLWSRAKPAL
ncbi:MAG: hypothetical protein KA746_13835 [Pyrinomonadaceae bacterium]|nr:hypothetical protein [Pyrinomonadaceae bacterium]MBP6211773.1 hypothetical protein [Pyrinomonadaceae bacterium]